VIPENGEVMIYGDGGASKTTLAIDLGLHLGRYVAGPHGPREVQKFVEAALVEEGFDPADPRIAAESFDAIALAETPPPSEPTRPSLAAAPSIALLRHRSRGRSRAPRCGTTRRRRSGTRARAPDDPLGDRSRSSLRGVSR
jgi:hypothetical protein